MKLHVHEMPSKLETARKNIVTEKLSSQKTAPELEQKEKGEHNSATKGPQGPKLKHTYSFLKPQVLKRSSKLVNSKNIENHLF